MPPKPKFTKEEIVTAALELVSEKGIEELTSRELGGYLGSSARPIFTVFHSMEDVYDEVRKAAIKRYDAFVEKSMDYTPAFKQFGKQMILFAKQEPKLFQLLFMTEDNEAKNFDDVFTALGNTANVCVDIIKQDYGLTHQEARQLFEHVWIYTFGIGALCATGVCDFTDEEINEMLGQNFIAILMLIKSGKHKTGTVHPDLK